MDLDMTPILNTAWVLNYINYLRLWSTLDDRVFPTAGLRDKLAEKYLQNGRIIPPAPDKSIIGMTKIKMSKEEDNTDQSGTRGTSFIFFYFLLGATNTITSGFWPVRVRPCTTRARLFRLINTQNGALRIPRPSHRCFADPSVEIYYIPPEKSQFC